MIQSTVLLSYIGLLVGTMLSSSPQSVNDQAWRFLKEEEGIKLFVKETPSGYVRLRLELTIDGHLRHMKRVLNHVEEVR